MNSIKICVIGLGYVGLPLARLFSTKYKTVGFDMNKARVDALMAGHDATLEVSDMLLQEAICNYGEQVKLWGKLFPKGILWYMNPQSIQE